jgi:hypothetical protein
MIVTVLKRKMGPENFQEWVDFAPEYNRLDAAEVKEYKFRQEKGSDE